jgi:hypothetical protein
LAPEQESAQLFRGWQGNDASNNFSNLPGADPYTKRQPDYGAENVSEAIRNEVNGRAPVRPAPDFLSNAPLARAVMQSPIPFTHTVQRPTGEDSQVQPPFTKFYNRSVAYPYWVEQSVAAPHQNLKRSDRETSANDQNTRR